MKDKIIKCTNCGTITSREHLLPLCGKCFDGLEDYEDFLAKSLTDIQIGIYRKPVKVDGFLQL